MSPENNPSGTQFVGIAFSFSEALILSTLPKHDQQSIITNRFQHLDALVERAKHVGVQKEKVIPQKRGEPDWREVERNAKKAFGQKFTGDA
ncbi:MAG: hypothetical protein WAV51_05150 [Microgenomates group bacterium]